MSSAYMRIKQREQRSLTKQQDPEKNANRVHQVHPPDFHANHIFQTELATYTWMSLLLTDHKPVEMHNFVMLAGINTGGNISLEFRGPVCLHDSARPGVMYAEI